MTPTLEALKDLGGSARSDEILEHVVKCEGLTEEQQAVKRRPGDHMSLLDYRLAWARNCLRNLGAIENSSRGVWTLTDVGRHLTEDDMTDGILRWQAEWRGERGEHDERRAPREERERVAPRFDTLAGADAWKDDVLEHLAEIPADTFERLMQRLLREAGFHGVEVLRRTGDGGIEGIGVLHVSLVSFPTYFECSRDVAARSASAVLEFRGAMAGRAEKGLLVTTGTFTHDARAEAARAGAPLVRLVDGDELCDLLKEHGLGVSVRERTVEDVEVDGSFFDAV